MATKISRAVYADMYGPTTGDKVRLADTELFIEVERDLTHYGEEVKFGGGKVIRDGATPLYRTSLPRGAHGFQEPIGNVDQGLSQEDGTIAFWGPLYPGSQEVRYAYALPVSDADGSVWFRHRFDAAAGLSSPTS